MKLVIFLGPKKITCAVKLKRLRKQRIAPLIVGIDMKKMATEFYAPKNTR